MKKLILPLFFMLTSAPSFAIYNANMKGVVTQVSTYTDSNQIYFTLNTQPSSHPKCDHKLFSIDASVPTDRRSTLLSRLLAAHAMGEPITVGYDKEGDCSHGRIRVHRVG